MQPTNRFCPVEIVPQKAGKEDRIGCSAEVSPGTKTDKFYSLSLALSADPRFRHTGRQMLARRYPGRLTDHKLRLNRNFRLISPAFLDPFDHRLRGDLPHPQQRLTYRGQRGVSKSGPGNIVESNHRH